MKNISRYVINVLISISILINVILGGKSNQTFSARNYARKLKGLPNLCFLIDKVFFWEKNHCRNAWDYWRSLKDGRYIYMTIRKDKNG